MLAENDRKYLFRALDNNACVLLVGAGFSKDALNTLGQPIPDGIGLARLLWAYLSFPGEFDGTDLSEIFEAALASGKPLDQLKGFLEAHLLAEGVPGWYLIAARIYWYRIYGTNVDNIVELAYRGAASRLQIFAAPKDDYRERDQFLRTIQYIKLNGSLPGDPRNLTFAPRQYARRTSEHDVWYDQFVRDYVFHPTIFVGTELREPLFWQAIESREKRGNNPEERPRSFLISPSVSPAKLPILESLNVQHVPARADEFFGWLESEYGFPGAPQVLRTVVPDVQSILDLTSGISGIQNALPEFLSAFPRVPELGPRAGHPKTFFLGAPPTWQDIANEYDAPRECTNSLITAVTRACDDRGKMSILGVLGAGGAGKSTILRRLGATLRQAGKQVFLSEATQRPKVSDVVTSLRGFPERSVLLIDNAPLLGFVFLELIEALARMDVPPVVVFAARYNLFERQLRNLATNPDLSLYEVPDLTDSDIQSLLRTLEQNRQLGVLEALGPRERVLAFKVRARKQILVAMREATRGLGFDDIIRSEFDEIEGREARLLHLCAALGTSELLDLSREQWLACAGVPPAEATAILRRQLRGVLHENTDTGRIVARHPVIAEYVIDAVASRADLLEAYKRLLSALAHDIYGGEGRRRRSWRLFVRLINHATIYERFTANIEMARAIYESIAEWFRRDGHFWLQYANLELEFGEPQYARTHLAHAEGLMPDNDQVLTTKAHLALRESLAAGSLDNAIALRRSAEEILFEQISRVGAEDEYPYHVYLSQPLAWVHRWGALLNQDVKTKLLECLDEIGQEATGNHPLSRRVRDIAQAIRKEYLSLAQ